MPAPHDIAELHDRAEAFRERLASVKTRLASNELTFYPYDTLGNFLQLKNLLVGEGRDLLRFAEGRPIADVGAADGDLSFFLESLGYAMEIVDHAPTNYNGLRGARAVKEALGSSVTIRDVDLDEQFQLPGADYGLVFFLGILYHLKNPFYALERLAKVTRYCVLSTRVAAYAGDAADESPSLLTKVIERARGSLPAAAGNTLTRKHVARMPMAYLLDADECNGDSTNYWIFTEAGLRRLLRRTGWEIIDFATTGAERSDPASREGDQRAFVFARSRRAE